MALDYFAIASQGVYPTPVPTMARRMALAISQGLLNIALPGTPESSGLFDRVLLIGSKIIQTAANLTILGRYRRR